MYNLFMNNTYETPVSIKKQKVEKIVSLMKRTVCILGAIFILIGLYIICFKSDSDKIVGFLFVFVGLMSFLIAYLFFEKLLKPILLQSLK